MLVLQEGSLEREYELPAGGWEWLDNSVVGLEESSASYSDGQLQPVFLCDMGLLSKPITVNLAFPLNIIGSGSNPACFDILFALSLKALPYSFSDEEKRAG